MRSMTIEEKLAYLKGLYTGKKSGESEYEIYSGKTSVTPDAHEGTVLLTKDKVVMENITVSKIPSFEVSNALGNTFYIASEV